MTARRKRVYFVHANPEAWKNIGMFLAARGEVVESETTILEVAGREYPCWQIDEGDVRFVKQYIKDNSDIATSVLLFERYEGQRKNARDVSFMLRSQKHVREAVLAAVAEHVTLNASAQRSPALVRRAK